MILTGPEDDVGAVVTWVLTVLRDRGLLAVADELEIAIQADVEESQPLKMLTVHEDVLFYGRRSLGPIG